ncbi:cyclin-I2 [Phoca vitulina]|uniref:cyclin-I2 n=1 Tax=Phoca vitulina TaxID=9720 RepID=UPI0013965373|nr:cyclin-I2 [Phoca vitulina]
MASGGRLPAPAGRGPRAAAPALRAAPGPAPWPVPWDRGGPLDERRLVAHLQLALGREARPWRGGQPQVEICHEVGDLVLWLLELKNIFDFSQTTFNLALTTFGRLLVSLKIRENTPMCHDYFLETRCQS